VSEVEKSRAGVGSIADEHVGVDTDVMQLLPSAAVRDQLVECVERVLLAIRREDGKTLKPHGLQERHQRAGRICAGDLVQGDLDVSRVSAGADVADLGQNFRLLRLELQELVEHVWQRLEFENDPAEPHVPGFVVDLTTGSEDG
jgi:hypothetical protein